MVAFVYADVVEEKLYALYHVYHVYHVYRMYRVYHAYHALCMSAYLALVYSNAKPKLPTIGNIP